MSAITRFFSHVMSKQSFNARFLRQNGYELLDDEPLGEGSYAKVRRAYSRKMKLHVAIKILDRRKAPDDFLKRFLPRELSVIQLLEHPHIIRLYEVLDTGDRVFVVMDIATGGDLLDYIKTKGFVKENLSRRVFTQMLQAVKHCHENGVVHRDLKCENILLDDRANVKITDFGFSKQFNKSEFCKTFCGSAAYAAYEILKGIPYDGEKADVWSMGVVLYTMVTGRMPFDDSDMKVLLGQITRGVSFSKPKQQISDDCKDLIRRMLNLDFTKRISIEDIKCHRWLAGSSSTQRSGSSHSGLACSSSTTVDDC
ncbi:testis-specific serine/threonine-protein kinase 3-like [Orbicella faveolata]|uniref:testis-specific serine/threonine-protein kinase 3-like n=1 Tax=Orbicella faveolata TaxID=48498 RepID=UPI0009E4E9E9|nr:testis-specific serine/threonine-protein kinase 3-like [Orbicella faveolata]